MDHSQTDVTARISERQMRLWNALHRGKRESESGTPGKSSYRFLTLSRDEGSLGNEIATKLAARLKWHVFDREILNYIAQNNHVREDMVGQLDEKSQGLMHEAILRLLRMPESAPFGLEEYHESLLKTLAMIASRGEAVMIGRGANFALRDTNQGLHVRITGSFEIRLHRECERLQWPMDKVRADLAARDADRRQFIRYHFKKDFDDPRYYDISFNTDTLSVEQIVEAIDSMMHQTNPLEEKQAS